MPEMATRRLTVPCNKASLELMLEIQYDSSNQAKDLRQGVGFVIWTAFWPHLKKLKILWGQVSMTYRGD